MSGRDRPRSPFALCHLPFAIPKGAPMPRATCRCGESLIIPAGADRVVCTKCGARVRVRRGGLQGAGDGFIRFHCPCGRRLKVSAANPPKFGRCPDCGKAVPVPVPAPAPAAPSAGLPAGHPETPTAELSTADLTKLDEWARRHLGSGAPTVQGTGAGASSTAIQTVAPTGRIEAGLRVCPRCRKPV